MFKYNIIKYSSILIILFLLGGGGPVLKFFLNPKGVSMSVFLHFWTLIYIIKKEQSQENFSFLLSCASFIAYKNSHLVIDIFLYIKNLNTLLFTFFFVLYIDCMDYTSEV